MNLVFPRIICTLKLQQTLIFIFISVSFQIGLFELKHWQSHLTSDIDNWHWHHLKSHWKSCDIVQSLFSNGFCKVMANTENIVLSFQDQSSAKYFSSSSSYRPYLESFFMGSHERSCMQMILFWSRKPRKISVLNCRYSWQTFYNQNVWKSAWLRLSFDFKDKLKSNFWSWFWYLCCV